MNRDYKIMQIVCDQICGCLDDVHPSEVEDACDNCPMVEFMTRTSECQRCIHNTSHCGMINEMELGVICESFQPIGMYIGKEDVV